MRTLFTISITTAFMLVMGFNVQAQMFIFPQKGQSPDQQELDEFTCYKWAKQQTGVDPNQQVIASSSPAQQRGGALSGAMGGAALGAIGGAIAGDAGKGAAIGAAVGGGGGLLRQRRGSARAEEQQRQASGQHQQSIQTFNRAYGVCLEGKGYKVG
ncbi:MAG: glycine zipper domain-containing protein [Nitrospirota bacterium]|nr:glycine zipper domain-containing protein [Nitrospirota bacterium]